MGFFKGLEAWSAGRVLQKYQGIAVKALSCRIGTLYDSHPDAPTMPLAILAYCMAYQILPAGLGDYLARNRQTVVDTATALVARDSDLRKLLIETLWVTLGIYRAQNNRPLFDKLTEHPLFLEYMQQYPMPDAAAYKDAVTHFATKYGFPELL